MKRMSWWVLWLVLGWTASASAQARELAAPVQAAPQPAPVPPSAPPPPPAFGAPAVGTLRLSAAWSSAFSVLAVYLEDGTLSFRHPTFVMAHALSVSLDFGSLLVRGTLPFGYLSEWQRDIDNAEVGNASVEAYADVPLDPTQRLLLGGGLVMPSGTDPTCLDPCSTTGMRVRTRAWQITVRDGAAWSDETVTLVPTVDYTLGIPWFLLHAAASVPIFFPIDPNIGGPQPAARGAVDVMPSLEIQAAVRVEHWVDVGASFLGWVIATVDDATALTPPPPTGVPVIVGWDRHVGQRAQAALTAFVRTDPELDAPVGGALELLFDLDAWHTTEPFAYRLGQSWSIQASLHGGLDVGL